METVAVNYFNDEIKFENWSVLGGGNIYCQGWKSLYLLAITAFEHKQALVKSEKDSGQPLHRSVQINANQKHKLTSAK